jgi:glycosyltransferase involved in cell wall biosynthesis
MTDAPAVSIVIPTYNRAHLIERALRSVLAQTFQDFEVLIMDDASTDDTAGVLQRIGDARVRHIRSDRNLGPPAQRNRGLHEARAELVAYQDSDDEWFLDKLEKQVERLRALPAEFALTYCALIRHEESGLVRHIPNRLAPGREREDVLRCNTETFTQSWLARRDALLDCGGFDERLHLWDDWEFLLRICQKYRVDVDGRTLCIVYETPGSMVKQNHHRLNGMEILLQKHGSLMAPHRSTMSRNLYVLGRFHVVAGNTRRARELLLESLRQEPLKLRTWVLLALMVPGARFATRVLSVLDQWRYRRPVVAG